MSNLTKVNLEVGYQHSIATRYVVAVLASWSAEACTYPLDLTKMRLQIQGEVAAVHLGVNKVENKGMIRTALGVVKYEGVLKLWSGLMPMCQRHAIYSGSRLIFYENIRNCLKDDVGHISLLYASVSGVLAGALAQWIASPSDLVKVQMQAEGRRRLIGLPPRILNSRQAYVITYKEGGLKGLWRGAVPSVQRAALVNLGDLTAYDYTKQTLVNEFQMQDGLFVHSISAVSAGLVAAIVGTPVDVMKTRLMNQPVGPDGRGTLYSGMIDCLKQTVKNEGLKSLYRGFLPVWMRLGPWAMINWLVFEKVMIVIGGDSF